ncbi:MAG: class I SAM-dependent methyltransferase [Nitrospinae bacterium]|nr:class I SAM-dependent methyltransferase [Nitrospinota bacterium]
MIRVDWDQYSSKRKVSTGTDIELLQRAVKGVTLDIGCGIGKHLAMLDNVVLKVGIDAGLAGLQMGKLMFPNLTLICCSVYQLPFKSATFDSAVMMDGWHFMLIPKS